MSKYELINFLEKIIKLKEKDHKKKEIKNKKFVNNMQKFHHK